jgi:hypothetical protein
LQIIQGLQGILPKLQLNRRVLLKNPLAQAGLRVQRGLQEWAQQDQLGHKDQLGHLEGRQGLQDQQEQLGRDQLGQQGLQV